jgi:L-asparaginase/Glu-tRNA(Gln) amidotransferase subunit D
MRSTETTIDGYDGLLIAGFGNGCAAEGMVE